jgi:SAM-dependent methyltransferase
MTNVRAFYDALPFNFADSTADQAQAVCTHNQVAIYEPLDRVLREERPARLLDVGSGAGWFVNSVAHWYGLPARGLDFCAGAVARARETATAVGVNDRVEFVVADIFDLPEGVRQDSFPVVNSIGVLHHTRDCREACRIAISLVEPGGYFHLGLYHRYGRKPLLDMFEPVRRASANASSEGEREAVEADGFERWKRLHTATSGDTFSLSWYRDQCLHPHETQWTLGDTLEWFDEFGVEPLSTSLNRFAATTDWDEVVAAEPRQEALGRQRIDAGVFFPGFFTVFGRKQ